MARTRCMGFALAAALVVHVALVVPADARAQCQVDKVTASDGNANAGDQYGWSVEVNGNYAVVGADVADGGGSNPQADTGVAFLLKRDGLNWVEIQKLVANDTLSGAGDEFGASVAMSDNAEFIVVGAIKATGKLSVIRAGAVFVFKRYQDSFPCAGSQDCTGVGLATCTNNACEGLTWAIETKLLADDPKTDDDFGFSVDISGDVVVVGAWRADNGFSPPSPGDAGAAYVFRRYQNSFPCQSIVDCQEVGLAVCVFEQGVCEGVTWLHEKRLTASDAGEQGFFGNSVSIEANRIAVGARGLAGPGGVYLFDYNGTTWQETQKLTASDGLDFDAFGQAVDLHRDSMVVTALNADPAGVANAGKAYVYRRIAGTFGDERILTASNPASTDRFGRSASLHGDNLLIGARDTDVPASRAGSAYLFHFDGTDWNEIEEIRAADGEGNDRFGHAVSLSETYGIVGAYRNDDDGGDSGSAYVFALGLGRDCNENLIPDDCDVLAGTEPDGNNNGTPDVCECHGDVDCGGGNACSFAICNQDSLCELLIDSGACRIDSVCYGDGTPNPANSCQVCNASADQKSFTPVAGAPPCEDDGNGCTLDVCLSGFCNHRFIEGCACGDPTTTVCSRPDTLNGEGVCDVNDLPVGTVCTDDGNPCTDNLCDGVGNCGVIDLLAGTSCPDDGNPCTDNVCDGAGNCGAIDLPEGTACPDSGNPCTDNVCDGAGSCGEMALPAGTVCPDDGNPCTDNACDGAGSCGVNLAEGTACPSGGNVCTDDVCDGVGGCGVHLPPGTFCTSDGDLCTDDLCDGSGICEHIDDPAMVCPATVQSHQKISDTQGGFTGTLDNDDRFGGSLAALGDLDGDGVGDLAVGTPRDDDGGDERGAVWVLLLNADGTVNSHQKISDTQEGFVGRLDDDDLFGGSLAALGDLDGDGVGDLAVGAIRDDDGGLDRGAVWVLFLNGDGTVKSHRTISATRGGFTGTLDNSDFFGWSVVAMGDLDGDGVGDLAVGAIGDDDGGDDRGALWVLFLNTNGTIKTQQKISDSQGGFVGGLADADWFGSSVASLGDLNADGVGDLAVGAIGDDDGGNLRGAVWVLFLDTDGSVKRHQKISGTQGAFTGTLDDGDQFGSSVAALGDVDGDGIVDLAVGALGDNDGGNHRGAVWVLFLNADGTVKSHQKISDVQGGFMGGLDNHAFFGGSLASLGDLDGDGVVDLAVGASGDDDGGDLRGAVWMLFLDGAPDPCFGLDCDDGVLCTEDVCKDGVCENNEIPGCRNGACCFSVACLDFVSPSDCDLISGTYLGTGLTCTGDPDSDNLYGCDDGCPFDANKAEPGVCGCGVPDADTDEDNIMDCNDACPELFGIIELSGCPLLGACCFEVGVCLDNRDPQDCAAAEALFQGNGSACDDGCGVRPDPAFVQPAAGVTKVHRGDTVHISFNAGNHDDAVQWRLFCLTENDPTDVPPDELGTQLLTGSGNLGSFDWDTSAVPDGSYRLGLSVTDSGLSVAQSILFGFAHLIVTIPNDSASTPTVSIDPFCDSLQAFWPPNCAIDARQPSTLDGLTPQGWIALDVKVGPTGCTLTEGDLSVDSVPNGPAPTVSNVSQAGTVATVTFGSILPQRNWTCVSLTADPTQQVCLGNLPGDVNSDGTSNPALDLGTLIDCVNAPGSCIDFQANIDRTGLIPGVLDITRLVDLLNGAGEYDSWTGASFDGLTCPSD